MNATRSANIVLCAAVEIHPSSSLGNPGGSSSLIELAISQIIRLVSFFEPVAAIVTLAEDACVEAPCKRLP